MIRLKTKPQFVGVCSKIHYKRRLLYGGPKRMDLKPLFPDMSELRAIAPPGTSPERILISLPVLVDPSLHEKALTDFRQAICFISESSRNSEATFLAYRSAIERYFLFLWFKQAKTLQSMDKRDFLAFIEFAKNPDPEWIGVHARRFCENAPNPEWRPFAIKPEKGKTIDDLKRKYQTQDKTIQAVMSRLSSMFSYLVANEYIGSNPVAQIRGKQKLILNEGEAAQLHSPIIKRLSVRQMEYVKIQADLMASENPEMHERTRFIIYFMLSLYLRISELVPSRRHTPMMKDFFRDSDGAWWFRVVGGKGNKTRIVPMDDSDVAALSRYRISRNLHPYPGYNEEEPLIHKVKGHGGVTSDRNIRLIIQSCFDRAKQKLMQDGFAEDASTLSAATAHWLRHTGISEDLNTNERPLLHVRDDAGHSDLKTTSIYAESDLRERHQSKQRKITA
ncbi:tyrosine-type recombinase/integrase [Pseudomonas luteola]